MLNKQFIETYPLYKKFPLDRHYTVQDLNKIPINLFCDACQSSQTFVMVNEFHEIHNVVNQSVLRKSFRLAYLCVHCQKQEQTYFVRFDKGDGVVKSLKDLKGDDTAPKWAMKIGQYPAWGIDPDKNLSTLLGDEKIYLRKGLVLESQGYGIGAYGYYRRIVEIAIDKLIAQIDTLLADTEKAKFAIALESTKKTRVAQEKIDLVKDLLPPVLRPSGYNPLGALYEALSEGIHSLSDDECLELASAIREALTFLVVQLETHRQGATAFTTSMKKILDAKAARESRKN